MATISLVAAGCVSFALSAFYPWYWTKRWGEHGFTCCQSTGATGATHPQAGCLSCRWDCGWHHNTFHEVHAFTLERDSSARARHDPNLAGWHQATGLPLDMGERGLDIVSEQYGSAMKMKILRDGTVVNPLPSATEEARRSTAGGIEVVDLLREGPTAGSSRWSRITALPTRMADALKPEGSRLAELGDKLGLSGLAKQPATAHRSDETLETSRSIHGEPQRHD